MNHIVQQTQLFNTTLLIFISTNNSALLLKHPLQLFQAASLSPIFTISSFLCHRFPDLSPPNCSYEFQKQVSEEYPSEHLSFNKYCEFWCSFLSQFSSENREEGFLSKRGDMLCIIKKIDNNFFERIRKQRNYEKTFQVTTLENLQNCQIYKEFFVVYPIVKKIAILVLMKRTHNDPIRPSNRQLPNFKGIWYENGDSWSKYEVFKEESPTGEELSQFDTLILTGSELNVNNYYPQIDLLEKSIRKALQLNKRLRIVAFCFGHQMIAKMFGGEVQTCQMLCGVQSVYFNQKAILQKPYLGVLQKFDAVLVAEVHEEYVTKKPEGFMILASSQSTQNECFLSDDERILTFQWHPQCTGQNLYGLGKRWENYYNKPNLLSNGFKRYNQEALSHKLHKQSTIAIRQVIRKFIDHIENEQ